LHPFSVKQKGAELYFFYYFPTGLDVRTRRSPVITYFLAAMCVILFIFYKYGPVGRVWNLSNLIFLPAAPMLPTSLSYVFLHTGWMHLVGNMVYLVIFGRALEDRYGPGRFFAIFALTAVAGAWVHAWLVAWLAPRFLVYGVIGASGATSGLLGAFMVRFYYARIEVAYWVFMPLQAVNRAGRRFIPAVIAVFCWFAYQGAYAAIQYGMDSAGVAYGVHVGGFGAGVVLALLFGSLPAARAEKRLASARRAFAGSEFFAARADYLDYLDRRPGDGNIHAETARTCLCGGERGLAANHYAEAVSKHLEAGERGEAEKVLSEAMRSIEGFALPEKMHLDLAFGMERAMKYDLSLTAYGNFIERYPFSGDAPFILLRMAGIHERRFDRPDMAARCYERIVRCYPDDSWADFADGEIWRLGRGETAAGEKS
jgi:membrane associated rhomboid family serine protease